MFHAVAPPFWERVFIATGDALPIITANITSILSRSRQQIKRNSVPLRHGGVQMSHLVYIPTADPEKLQFISLILHDDKQAPLTLRHRNHL